VEPPHRGPYNVADELQSLLFQPVVTFEQNFHIAVHIWSQHSSGGFKRDGGEPPPLLAHFCFSKILFFRVKGIISLCAFAINEDGADKLSSSPVSKFLDPPLARSNCAIILRRLAFCRQ